MEDPYICDIPEEKWAKDFLPIYSSLNMKNEGILCICDIKLILSAGCSCGGI